MKHHRHPGGVPVRPKHKSPSKVRRLQRRAEARALNLHPATRSKSNNREVLSGLTLKRLKEIASDRKIAGRSKMSHGELVTAIEIDMAAQAMQPKGA